MRNAQSRLLSHNKADLRLVRLLGFAFDLKWRHLPQTLVTFGLVQGMIFACL